MTPKEHLAIVSEISDILERLEDSDDVYFIMRTLENLYMTDSKEDNTNWLFQKALKNFMESTNNRDWFKNNFNFKDASSI